jgi:arabinogalactan oligomer/maltooligosaccharide transport system permease protein
MAASVTPLGTQTGSKRLRESLYAYGYLAPALIAMVVASFVPIAFTIFVSLTSWDLYHPALVEGFHFVGLANFKEVFQSFQGEFLGVIVWTLVFAGLGSLLNFFIGLVLAYLLNNPHMWERNLYRTILIIPWALPGTIMLLAWRGLLNTDFGAINVFLSSIHFWFFSPGRIPWLDDPNWARTAVILVNAWLGFPFMMTACLGALQSIPPEINQAAEVDGAGIIVRFWRITFPLLRSATLPLVISTFAYNLNNFGAVYLLTHGDPVTNLGGHAGATDILPSYVYKLALEQERYGLAAAYGIISFLFIGGLSLINMKYSRAFEEIDR